MKFPRSLIPLFFALTLSGCETPEKLAALRGEGTPTPASTPTSTPTVEAGSPLQGTWMTKCLDMGGGENTKIYANVDSYGEARQAVLTFEYAGCTGAYKLSDSQGGGIDEPQHEFSALEMEVEGIPAGFSVLRITNVFTNEEMYILLYRGDGFFQELVAFPSPHATWDEWLQEPDVKDFAADPLNYQPTGGGISFYFESAELPEMPSDG